jgi:hypothetical protein
MSQGPTSLEQTVRVTQIITGALVMGVVTFAAIAVPAIGALNAAPNGVLVSGLGAAFAVLAFVLHLAVPAVMRASAERAVSDQQLYGLYLSKTIIGLALLEGAAFFNLIALMVEHNWWSLAIVGGLVLWMLALFPTRTRVSHWVEARQMQSLGEGH